LKEILMQVQQNRRDFLASASLAAAAGVLGGRAPLANEGPPETTTVLIGGEPGICIAPQYLAEELLRAEGFTEVRYPQTGRGGFSLTEMVARGEADFAIVFVLNSIIEIEAGKPLTLLAGIHSGCFELFAHDGIASIKDLKGRSVVVSAIPGGTHYFVSAMASYVGLDPVKDIDWIASSSPKPIQLFADGKADAFLAFPPAPQELRARRIGRVILNTGLDRPWSQYFCCVLAGNADFVRKHPLATKRATRAILKAADLCLADPKGAAQQLVDSGLTERYDYALSTLEDVPYGTWRNYDPEDAVRFFALRLHETGFIKSTPRTIIENGTDWRFLNEIKRELKA
jgi:NitT/TauT family transport system substrate-binding protein